MVTADAAEIHQAAQALLDASLFSYQGEPIGTRAALSAGIAAENYVDCFIRDFVPSGLVFLFQGRAEIVRNFLRVALRLRGLQEEIEGHHRLPRVMPASFRVERDGYGDEVLHADFGDRAIGRVAPVDSMMWWVLTLQAYVNVTGDAALAEEPAFQRGLQSILTVMLNDRFEVFPTLLVPDASFMIDRRMGVYGHPLEIQALFFATLNAMQELLTPDQTTSTMLELAAKRRAHLTEYVRQFYWLDPLKLNEIHRYETEGFGHDVANPLNINPESIPDWVADWLPDDAGYLLGNLGPGRMDFRFFAQGNLLSMVFGLSSPEQNTAIMQLFDQRWPDLVGRMPVKLIYPALVGVEWQILTGSDPKNTPWSYHNGGNWPVLLWPFVAAALRAGRRDLASNAIDVARSRLYRDDWPEYYDGRSGRMIGRRSNVRQVWTAAGFILAEALLEQPDRLDFWDASIHL
ncbi:glycoside hydrolase 100 family protein [Acidihalobacter ferrooxydans]|uniref:beta-fructofuranosidase n=1 Tax=Acidihalobacter ferrooxydans TaxID=1765967 RepID=A0A1P8UJH3_9GAMM|nr:glycoside hydrolase 100 family protein [Acidihalobacter ferrooxydans]APZ43983.1 alkaline invertase [Acidihalobacter ferrooxydans]